MKILEKINEKLGEDGLQARLSGLNLRQKIAQLIHIPAWSNRGGEHLDELRDLVNEHEVGGVVFFQGDAPTQAAWTQALQKESKLPLLISMDAEWGLGMRLDRTPAFPYQMTLGALEKDDLIYEMGKELGRQLREIGVHVNFAPDVDINTQAANPVIGFRSFGADPAKVAAKAAAYAQGLEDGGIMPVIKHFPGHGDTRQDSHLSLPVLDHGEERLESLELKPFEALIREGIPAVMSAHLHIPAWDPRPNVAVTHSREIIEGKLRKKLGFEGLIFTDALDMKGVSAFMRPAQINLEALLAGHDALLFCVDVPGSIAAIEQAVEEGKISEDEITKRCARTLAAKEILSGPPGAWNESRAFEETSRIRRSVAREALTWLKKPNHALSDEAIFLDLNMKGRQEDELAHHQLGFVGGSQYLPGKWWKDFFEKEKGRSFKPIEALSNRGNEPLAVLVRGLDLKAKNQFGMRPEMLAQLDHLLEHGNCWLVWMGSPYGLNFVNNRDKAEAILLTYQHGSEFEQEAAAVILGTGEARGILPILLDG